MMVANGDKAVFRWDDRGFCLYRTIGPYLVVFADPVVRTAAERDDLLNVLFAYATEIDRRPLFYQVSLEWIPPLHDRGYAFFKLGEEAHVERVEHRAHRRHREVSLEVLLVVPHEGADAVTVADSELGKRGGQPIGALHSIEERAAVFREMSAEEAQDIRDALDALFVHIGAAGVSVARFC